MLRGRVWRTSPGGSICLFICLSSSTSQTRRVVQADSTYLQGSAALYLRRQYEALDPWFVRRSILGFGPRLHSNRKRELFEEAGRFGIQYGLIQGEIDICDRRRRIAFE